MSTYRLPIAIAAAAATLAFATPSLAQDTEPTPPLSPQTPTPTQAQTPTPALQPLPPTAPPPVTTSPTPDAVAQPQPIDPRPSTTTTTQGAYATNTDRITEESRHSWPNKRLLVTGGSILALSYGASAIVGAQSDRESDKRLYIPVVGPWLSLADRNCGAGNPCGDNDNVAKAFIIASGAAQGAGVLIALSSLVIPERERVQVRQAAKPEVRVLPLTFVGGGGVGAIGRF